MQDGVGSGEASTVVPADKFTTASTTLAADRTGAAETTCPSLVFHYESTSAPSGGPKSGKKVCCFTAGGCSLHLTIGPRIVGWVTIKSTCVIFEFVIMFF